MQQEALFYSSEKNGIRCELCPHHCFIERDKRGICGVRRNVDNVLVTENYGVVSGLGMDPIEKKPLYHFYPGSHIYSIGSIGCNLKCGFCQNCDISQTTIDDFLIHKKRLPKELIKTAISHNNNIGIAFTYNEPIIFYEFMHETAVFAKESLLKTAMISNGFINEKPLAQIIPFIDAFNIDLKAFTNEFYKKQTKSRLEPVLKTLMQIKTAGKHLEITNLVIPSLNDSIKDFQEMVYWIVDNLGYDTVLHLSRYFPRHKLNLEPTSVERLIELYNIAKEKLLHVYLGNVSLTIGRDTRCHKCGALLIERLGYQINIVGLTENGHCRACGEFILSYI